MKTYPPSGRTAQEELVLGLCHEVENVLAGIRLGAHLVANGLYEGDIAAASATAEMAVARAGAWVGLLRPLLVAAPPQRVRVAADEMLRALDRSVGASAGGPRKVVIHVPRMAPDLLVDPDSLHHALIALVLAATEVTPLGGTVRVSARRDEARVVFSVEDEGLPLDPQTGGPRAALRGRWLLLALVGAAMRRQGGRLAWEKRPRGRGTRVRISLRAAPIAPRRRLR